MGADDTHDWQQQLEQERYREACDAIDRCAKAGADMDALKTLCREAGINIKHTVLGDEIRPARLG